MATFQNIVEMSLRAPQSAAPAAESALSADTLVRLNAAHQAAQSAVIVHFRNDVAALASEISRCASSLEGALDQITKELCQRSGVVGAAVALEHDGQFRCWSRYGNAPDLGVTVSDASAASNAAIETKSIVLVSDAHTLRGYPGVRAVAVLPLLAKDRVTGLLELLADDEAALNVELLGAAIAIAKVVQMWIGEN